MLFALLIGLFSLLHSPCVATDFTINQKITYDIRNNGQATATQDVQLINNLSQVYPRDYEVNISGIKITDIQAHDSLGDILKSSDVTDQQTNLKLSFGHPNVGKNQKNSFTLSYQIPDFAINKGNTWEIALPRYHSEANTDITLLAPISFGRLSFSSIRPTDTDETSQNQKIHLLVPANYQSRVLLIFGNYQLFDFSLKYHLANPSAKSVNTEIAIPPDTNGQKIIYQHIQPRPLTITQDPDGNWLAQYQLNPQQQLNITVDGQAKISSPLPDNQPPPDRSLTQEQNLWPTKLSTVRNITQSLTTPRQIYDYVVNHLDYNYNLTGELKRVGAATALTSPNLSLCTEFADLFVTLARAQNIPAREVEGFAYTNNPKIKPVNPNADILHAWAQYYDSVKHTWRSVDPTWAKTSGGIDYFNDLDLNHFVFVLHGTHDDYPPPPGSFRANPLDKTITVAFAQNEIEAPPPIPSISIQYHPPSPALLLISNPHLVSLSQLSITIDSLKFHTTIAKIPPLGKTEVSLPPSSFINSINPKSQKITISAQSPDIQPTSITTIYRPHLLNLTLTLSVLIIILLILGGIITRL